MIQNQTGFGHGTGAAGERRTARGRGLGLEVVMGSWVALAAAIGCGSSSGSVTACTPNETQSCDCSGGERGVQTCDAQGTGYSACACRAHGTGGTGGTAGSGMHGCIDTSSTETCAVSPDCCQSGTNQPLGAACVTADFRCHAVCTSAAECATGCCAQLTDGQAVCAPADVCISDGGFESSFGDGGSSGFDGGGSSGSEGGFDGG